MREQRNEGMTKFRYYLGPVQKTWLLGTLLLLGLLWRGINILIAFFHQKYLISSFQIAYIAFFFAVVYIAYIFVFGLYLVEKNEI